jgi:type III restriction enzyme
LAGARRSYLPDFVVCFDDGRGAKDPLHLVLEVSGEKEEEKEAKVATARSSWIPAVNNLGSLGRWAFYEIRDPWSCQKELRVFVSSLRGESAA